MRPLLAASMKMIIRDRQSLFWAMAFPILFLGAFRLFAFDTFGSTELLVAGDTSSGPAIGLVQALQDVDFLSVELTGELDEAGARELLEDGDANAVLLLAPTGQGASNALLLHTIDDPVGSSMTVSAIGSVVDAVNLAVSEAPRAIQLESRTADVDQVSFFEFLSPGIVGMGLMTFSTIGLAGSLSRYREEGVLRRIRATPLAPWRFFIATVIAHLIVATAQIVVLVTVAQFLGASLLDGLLWFFIIALVGTVVFLNLAVAVAGRVHGRGAVESATNAIVMPMMFLSGTFFPTSGFPDPVRWFVELLPLTHMLRAMRGVSLNGETLLQQGPELAVLGGWVLVTFVLARASFRLSDV